MTEATKKAIPSLELDLDDFLDVSIRFYVLSKRSVGNAGLLKTIQKFFYFRD